jgi:hypothetical protein
MDPNVVAPNIDSIQASPITAADSHIVDLTIHTSIHGKMEGGGIHKNNVVDREVIDLVETKDTSTRSAALGMDLITIAYPR